MAWVKTCTEFRKVRKAIESDEENYGLIIGQLIAICDKYSKEKWHYAEDYKELKEELEELSIDSLEEEDVDNMLSEFYDLCDIARVWLDF